jgi:Ca2+-binding RTX toxin-like protein
LGIFDDVPAVSVGDVISGLEDSAKNIVNYELYRVFIDDYILANNITIEGHKNAFAHAFMAAALARDNGRLVAQTLGDARELRTTADFYFGGSDSARMDTFRDLFNNEVGYRIGEHAASNALSNEDMAALVVQAISDGELIVSINLQTPDPRIPPINDAPVPAGPWLFTDGHFNGWPGDFLEFLPLVTWQPPVLPPQQRLLQQDSQETHEIQFTHGSVIIVGTSGGEATGGELNDIIVGSETDDVLAGGGKGYDLLFGEAGNDQLIGGLGLDRLFGGDGNDELFTASEWPNLEPGGWPFLLDENDQPIIRGGEDILNGGDGYDIYQINSLMELYLILVGAPGEVGWKQLPLPTSTIVEDTDGLGRLLWNGERIESVGQLIHTDWRSARYAITAERDGDDLVIRLPVSPLLGDSNGQLTPTLLEDWQYSSFYEGDVPPEFEGIEAGTIVIKNFKEDDLGFYFDGGFESRDVAAAGLTFEPGEPHGKAYDNLDGTGSFNANVDDATFSYDGRDLWVTIAGSDHNPVRIRGEFVGANFVRPSATTITELQFLDGTVLVSDIATSVAGQVAATLGTAGDDTLVGRDNETDYFNGGEGEDTYVITADSGSDVILRTADTQKHEDTLAFNFSSGMVFERYHPKIETWQHDQLIEILEERVDTNGDTRLYLSEQTILVQDRYYDYVNRTSLYDFVEVFNYTFTDLTEIRTNVQRMDVVEKDFLLSEATVSRSTGGEAGYDDLIITVGQEVYVIQDQFMEIPVDMRPTYEDIDALIFADNEVLTRELMAAATTLVMNANDPNARGSRYSETIIGSEISDRIFAGLGDDEIIGGLGDDLLIGDPSSEEMLLEWTPSAGSDTYVYNSGDGNDTIADPEFDGTGEDTLHLANLDPEDVVFLQYTMTGDVWQEATEPYTGEDNFNLIIVERATGARIEILNQFLGDNSGIEQIRFGEDTVFDRADILAAVTSGSPGFNFAPFARPDDLSGSWSNGTMIIAAEDLLLNDEDVENSNLSVVSVQAAVGGTVSLYAGVVTFVRDKEFAGRGSFSYTVSDGAKESTQTLYFDLEAIEEPPIEGDVIGTNAGETLTGTDDDNVMHGLGGDDRLIGLDGFDILYGGDGDDVLNSGLGGDSLEGGDGSDWAIHDDSTEGVTVDLAGGLLVPKASLTQAQLEAVFGENIPPNDFMLIIEVADATPGQLIAGFETIGLGYGGDADWDDLTSVENLGGTAFADFLSGDAVANHLRGEAGDDVLNGRTGADVLEGGDGADTYTWAHGDGNDAILDEGGLLDIDVLELAEGVLPLDAVLTRVGDDLILAFDDEELTLTNQFSGDGIESIAFDGGITWSRSYFEGLVV